MQATFVNVRETVN